MKFVLLLKLHNLALISLIVAFFFGCTTIAHDNGVTGINTKFIFKINKSLLSIQDEIKK